MDEEKKELIEEVFCDVLERFAFMFAEPVPLDELSFSESGFMKVGMSFAGELTGRIGLVVPGTMCGELASNVLGLDFGDEISEEQAKDSLRELLNVICGQFLTTYAGEEPVFDLSIPEVSKIEEDECKLLSEEDNTICFLVDNYPVLLNVRIEG